MAALLGATMMAGLFTDGLAHTNRPGLESFFTPWHAMLYSGFAVTAGWNMWLAAAPFQRHRQREVQTPYGLSVLGVAGFAVGGLGDMVWHPIFGVESGLEALLSPTHLVLLTGDVLHVGPGHRGRGEHRGVEQEERR